MKVEIRVPQLPESVPDATLVAWRKQPGDAVARDESLADLETDKVVLEVPAPAAGILQEIRAPAGSTVKNGDLLAVLEAGADSAPGPRTPSAAPPAPAARSAGAALAAPKLGPAAQRVADELKLPGTTIAAAAKEGRVAKSDLVAAAARRLQRPRPPGPRAQRRALARSGGSPCRDCASVLPSVWCRPSPPRRC